MDNKYSIYRDIRYQRTYRTLGKMSWWRIVLGIILSIYVLLLSGLISQLFAAREQFRLAEKLMISPAWMEKYKPDTKAFIEAGVLYQDGNIEAAVEAFGKIIDYDAADVMKSRALVKLASEKLSSGSFDEAYDCLAAVKFSFLLKEERQEYLYICQALSEYYTNSGSDNSTEIIEALEAMTSNAEGN